MLINNIVPILTKATTIYLVSLKRLSVSETYGISCGDKWEDAVSMATIIKVLSDSYNNSLVSTSQVPQLTSEQYECLLSKLTVWIKNNSGRQGSFNSDFSADFNN